jgi:rare lipoprotein A
VSVARAILFCFIALGFSACQLSSRSGGYYQDDGPPSQLSTADYQRIIAIPDAVPEHLPLSKTGNKPYQALGKSFTPLKRGIAYRKQGNASWYGKKYHGRRTSSGEVYDMYRMTAAHPILPLPSFVKVTNLENNKTVILKVNDRGPFLANRIIDVSYAAAVKLDLLARGTAKVEVELLDPSSPIGGSVGVSGIRYTKPLMQPIAVAPEVKAPTPVVPSQSSQQALPTSNIWVQIGAFSQLENAQKLMQNLASVQNVSIKQTVSAAGQVVYKVQLSANSDADSALIVERLRRMGYAPIIVKQ